MQFETLPWALAEGEHEDRPLLIRFRQFPPEFPQAKYPDRLNIFWEMAEAEEWGFPTAGESARLEQFENRLVEGVEIDAHSVLSVVLTTAGKRESVFHTADSGGFAQRLSEMPQESGR